MISSHNPSISAVILARNEEHNIRYCLETLRWCDEIVVVDMESQDRTVEIAREFTDRIYTHEQVLAFDIAKKYAVEKATGDWIFIVDADEMIPRTLAEELRVLTNRNDVDIVQVPFRHYMLGECIRYSGWGFSPHPRFFRSGSVEFIETIHGYMHERKDARVAHLELSERYCIIHFNYRDAAHFVEKLNRYTSIEAKHLYDHKREFSYSELVRLSLREFHGRYIKGKGYRDGVRGFALSLMMAFYRALTCIKLWELHEYSELPLDIRYKRIREKVMADWRQV